jgi:hypothetical protein
MTSFDVGIIISAGYIIHAIHTNGYIGAYFRRSAYIFDLFLVCEKYVG